MDAKLFSRIVRELLSTNDKVTLAGLGTFSAVDVPAYFSNRGFTINPPYRSVEFSLVEDKAGLDALVAFYAASNSIDTSRANRILREFGTQIRQELQDTKTVVFPGFGKIRLTPAQGVLFVPDEELMISPGLDCLEPLSLKSLGQAVSQPVAPSHEPEPVVTPEPVAVPEPEPVAVEPEPEPVPGPISKPVEVAEPEPVAEPETAPEPVPVPESEPESESEPRSESEHRHKHKSGRRKRHVNPAAVVVIVLVVLAVLFFVALAVVGRMYPEFVDPWLYSPEELEILHYKL